MLSRALPATEGGFTVVHTRENQPEAAPHRSCGKSADERSAEYKVQN